MAKIIKRNNSGFTMLPTELVKKGSFKAVGLWAFLAQLPDDWDFSVQGLAKIRQEGKDAIRTALRELEELGYIKRVQSRVSGQFGESDWELFWKAEAKKPASGNPSSENPTTENPTQYIDLTTLDLTTLDRKNTSSLPRAEKRHAGQVEEPKKKLPAEAIRLADFLKAKILENYPNRKIDRNYQQNWAEDLDKANRLDNREWSELQNAIIFASNDEF